MAFKALRMIVSTVLALAILLVIYSIWGTFLMTWKIDALVVLSHLTLSPGWNTIASNSASTPDYFFQAAIGFVLAIIIYGFLGLFTSTDSDSFS